MAYKADLATGLANLVFARPNTSVVEVGYKTNTPEIYFEQARFLHLSYFALVAATGDYSTALTVTDAQVRCVMDAVFHGSTCTLDDVYKPTRGH